MELLFYYADILMFESFVGKIYLFHVEHTVLYLK